MIDGAPGQLVTASVEGAPAGAAMGATLKDSDGNDVIPRSTALDEIAPGVWTYQFQLPLIGGFYVLIWDDGDVPLTEGDVASDDVRVRYSPSPTSPVHGPGPFPFGGLVLDRNGNGLADVAVNVWREASSTATDAGQAYDYVGLCSPNGRDALVEKRNRILAVDTVAYRVIDAIEYDALPHLELRLRKVKPDG